MRLFSRFRLGVLLATVLAASACDGIMDPDRDIAGTYVLDAVDGFGLPALEHENEYERQEFVAGSITLLEEGDWTASTTYRVTNRYGHSHTELASAQGIFSRDNFRVRLSSVLSAEISGDRLELTAPVDFPDRVLRYRKVR